MRNFRTLLLTLSVLLLQIPLVHAQYDPLKAETDDVESFELTLSDAMRNREVPIRVYLPKSTTSEPIVLFSHGLGGSRDNNAYLGKHFAARGYVTVFLQHLGSDEAVWQDAPLFERMKAMQKAASFENLVLRCEDVYFVLDQLKTANTESSNPLYQRLNSEKVGMCGHSFGAYTTQMVSGESFPLQRKIKCDPRIDAAIAYSPSVPKMGLASRAFSNVEIPWLLMTGTRDTSPIGGQTAESRQKVYPSLPASIDKYELVLSDAEHSAFSERALPSDQGNRNPNHHKVILALSTAFWDSYLHDDPQAKTWLTGPAAKQILEPKDKWQLHLKE